MLTWYMGCNRICKGQQANLLSCKKCMATTLASQAVGTTASGPGPQKAYTLVHKLTLLCVQCLLVYWWGQTPCPRVSPQDQLLY